MNSKNRDQPLWVKFNEKWCSTYRIYVDGRWKTVKGVEASPKLELLLNRNTPRVGGNTLYDSWWYRVYLGEKFQLGRPLDLDEIPSAPKNISHLVNHIGLKNKHKVG